MAYRLKASESVADGIRRIVQEEVESATGLLANSAAGKRDEAIHEARKSVKKLRGLLRLVEPELGAVYKRENGRLRDVGRQLSELRDAAALLEVFDQIRAEHKQDAGPQALRAMRRGLQEDKRATDRKLNPPEVMRQASAALQGLGKRVGSWPLEGKGFSAIKAGLEKSYRRGRRALKRAEAGSSPERYHDLRKRAKDRWYHVRVLENLSAEAMTAQEARLKDLEGWLGDDHNLTVLRAALERDPGRYGPDEPRRLFLEWVNQHQQKLRSEAVALGHELYEQKPRAFVKDLAGLWDTWQKTTEPAVPVKRPSNASARKAKRAA